MVDLAPGASKLVFDGNRTLTADGSTQYSLTLSPLDSSRYRLAWTGVGFDPGFRVARAVAVATGTLALTLLANQSLTVASSLGAVFGAVQVGDEVTLPGVSTGDTAVYDPLNEGDWVVAGAASTLLTLVRPPGTVFSGATQASVGVSANSQFLAYSAAGVHEGDRAVLSSAFPSSVRGAYEVVAVTSSYVEFTSSAPLAAQTIVPGATALAIYDHAKRWVRVESNQQIFVQVNGDAGTLHDVTPWAPADEVRVGWYERVGTTFSLTVVNSGSALAKVRVFSAE